MKKIFSIILIVSIVLTAALCGCSENTDRHQHSVLPGSDVCESCGREIKICSECQMVSDIDSELCWFCKSEFEASGS